MIKIITDTETEAEGSLSADKAIVASEALIEILGWELKDEGLCRADVCVPADRSTLETEGGVDLVAVASALGRPSIVDQATDTVAIGAPAADRSAALKDRIAPNFVLTDLDGVHRSLADYAGKKRLLVAFSSW